MKLFCALIFLFTFSCQEEESVELPYSKDQSRLLSIADSLSAKIYGAGNSASRLLVEDSALKILDNFLKDSVKELKDFYVEIGSIQTTPIAGKIALTAYARDKKFKYWMEVDYDTGAKMLADSLYKTVIRLKEGDKINANMKYLGEIKQETGYLGMFEARVVFKP
jgi:hypothetical protein